MTKPDPYKNEWEPILNGIAFKDPICRYRVEQLMPAHLEACLHAEYKKWTTECVLRNEPFMVFDQFKIDLARSEKRKIATAAIYEAISAVKQASLEETPSKEDKPTGKAEGKEKKGILTQKQIVLLGGAATVLAFFVATLALPDASFERLLRLLEYLPIK